MIHVRQIHSLALWERVRVRGDKFNLINLHLTSPHLGRGIKMQKIHRKTAFAPNMKA